MDDRSADDIQNKFKKVCELLNDSALFYYKYLETNELYWKSQADKKFKERQRLYIELKVLLKKYDIDFDMYRDDTDLE
jgi:hypothetical protein